MPNPLHWAPSLSEVITELLMILQKMPEHVKTVKIDEKAEMMMKRPVGSRKMMMMMKTDYDLEISFLNDMEDGVDCYYY